MSEVVKIGRLLSGDEKRDAIHVAVAPVVAGQELWPGDRVQLVCGSTEAVCKGDSPIGIVDPFLPPETVAKGGRFYLFLYPNTVTSLRHEWTHPAFPPANVTTDDKAISEAWLRIYAARMNTYDEAAAAYQRLMDGLRSGEMFAHGTDLHGLYELDDADDIRYHAERVLGVRIDWERYTFSCSC